MKSYERKIRLAARTNSGGNVVSGLQRDAYQHTALHCVRIVRVHIVHIFLLTTHNAFQTSGNSVSTYTRTLISLCAQAKNERIPNGLFDDLHTVFFIQGFFATTY